MRGGRRPGAERKRCVEPAAEVLAPSGLCPIPAPAHALVMSRRLTRADTANEKRRFVAPGRPEAVPAPGEFSSALTRTVSPGLNRAAGTNAAPAPAGSARSRPRCTPLREPITATEATSDGVSAEKMICEEGEASGVPGNGITRSPGSPGAGACTSPLANSAGACKPAASRSPPIRALSAAPQPLTLPQLPTSGDYTGVLYTRSECGAQGLEGSGSRRAGWLCWPAGSSRSRALRPPWPRMQRLFPGCREDSWA
jgi:hypothetical protein